MRALKTLFIAAVLFLIMVPPSFAYQEVARYTAPNGFEVISYSGQWNSTAKLKTVYDELLKNTHGEEFKLLSTVYIYPGSSQEGQHLAGHWFGTWTTVKGKLKLMPNRYINIYHGDTFTDIKSIARTLSHEYGHHFTYYYFFKDENKTWDDWRTSAYAKARGIQNNPYIGTSDGTAHAWLVEEIAANDYVQLFGSVTAKSSKVFYDIEGRASKGDLESAFSDHTYNLNPQGNPFLGLAANYSSAREYWLKAMGWQTELGNLPPIPSELRLDDVRDIGVDTKQYVFSWDPGQDEKPSTIEYTLVRFGVTTGIDNFNLYPVKTVQQETKLEALYGAVSTANHWYWDVIKPGVQLFTLYVKDESGFIVSSNSLAVDFKNPDDPDFVSIPVSEMNSGQYFVPRVKLNDVQLTFDVPAEIINQTTMVPFRKIFEELGAQVAWDEKSKTVTAVKDDTVITMTVGEDAALVNGKEITLRTPITLKNGRTLVPLRVVSESLGASVGWNQELKLVSIIYPGAAE